MKRSKFYLSFVMVLIIGLLAPQLGISAEKPLVIAFRGDAATFDPHARAETTTATIQTHIYETLVKLDQDLKIVPNLAESWKLIDDLTWEFKLKKGVKFQNGEPFNAEAAKFSLTRAKTWKKSQWKFMVPDYKEINIIDEYTIHFVTTVPQPDTTLMLNEIFMVPPKYFSETPEAILGKKPFGSGPYKLVEWVKDTHIKLVANDDWRGEPLDFKEVKIIPIPEGATRVAALISGEADVVWGVSIPDIPRIEKNNNTYVDRTPSLRTIFLTFDVFTDKGGPPTDMQPGLPEGAPNPFKNFKVRKAIAHAINVEEIVEYVMEKAAYPSSQLVPPQAFGFNPNIERPKLDLELAKKLMDEAGFKNGFKANYDCTNDRYINDTEVAEAIAYQLSKIGIKLNVKAQPKAVFFPKIRRYESPMSMAGALNLNWVSIMNTFFRERKGSYGRRNTGRYKNPELEKEIDQAGSEMSRDKAEKLRWKVSEEAYGAYYVLPLYRQENTLGFNKRVIGKARADERVFAFDMKLAK